MLKKILFMGIAVLLVTMLGIVSCAPAGPTAGEPIELIAAHQFRETSPTPAGLVAGLDWVAEQSGGKINVTYFHSGTLLTKEQLLPGILEGTADAVLLGYYDYPGRFPLTDVLDKPPGHLTAQDAVVDREFFKKYLMDEWTDFKVLWVNPCSGNVLMTKKPVRSLSDLSGLRIQAVGAQTTGLAALGASPQTVPWGEVYESISKGVLDGVLAQPYALKSLKWAEVAPYCTQIGLWSGRSIAVMNWDSYDSLPRDVRKLLDECWDWVPDYVGKIYDEQHNKPGYDFLLAQGGEIITLSPAELDKFRKGAMAQNEAWAAELEAKGLPGKKILEERYKFFEEYMAGRD